MQLAPIALNHVGVTVPDIHAAIEWYGTVFGCTHIMGPRLMSADVRATAETGSVLGPGFRRLLQAHLLTGNGTGLELFEPLDPSPQPPSEELEYRRRGPWHLAFTHPDVEGMIARIVAHGGRQHTRPHTFTPGRPWTLAYARDPWWTTIEVVSHSYAEMFANWPQPGAETAPVLVDPAEAARLRTER